MTQDTISNSPETALTPNVRQRKRIPMSVARQKLQVVDQIPDYHLHWALESNLSQYLQAGYEFVHCDEVQVNQVNVGNDSTISGNASLGTRVTIHAGTNASGQPESHVLMKLPLEFWNEDRRAIEDRNASVLSNVFRNEQILGSDKGGHETSYVDPERTSYVPSPHTLKPLFQRPTRKAK